MGHNIKVKSDHLPLKKFLEKKTLNVKVNNWVVELEQFKIELDWISGVKNTLADSLSRLLDMTPEAEPTQEPSGEEFGVACFEELESAKVHEDFTELIEEVEIEVPKEIMQEVKIPIPKKHMLQLQKNDEYCRRIVRRMRTERELKKIFILDDGILYRLWLEDGHTYKCIVVPQILRDPLLVLGHNRNGHNGSRRTYSALKRNYYWLNMKKEVFYHCKNCSECILQNQTTTDSQFGTFTTPDGPMQFICMDIVGPILPVSSRGNRFCLTVIDMLTGYTMAVPIPNKSAETIVNTYMNHVYSIFRGSSRMLTDNGSEFKNDVFDEVCAKLGIKRVYSPVYTPQSNGKLEGFHQFFKACISKHIRGNQLEWDEIVPLATAAYNFFPCQSSRESPFVLMFGRDPITPFLSLLEPSPQYWGERGGHLHLDTLQRLYAVMAENLKRAREMENAEIDMDVQKNLKIGDLVLVRNINSGVFEPKYSPNYRIIAIYGNNHIAVKAPDGKVQVHCRGYIKKINPVDKVVSLLPSTEDYEKFGRKTKLLLHPDNIPDTKIALPNRECAGTMKEESEISENYQDSFEKWEIPLMKGSRIDQLSCTMTKAQSELGENYQNSLGKSKASKTEMLNCIDYSSECLNQNITSLISASGPPSEKTTVNKHDQLQQKEGMGWNKIKNLLLRPTVETNVKSGFSFFL